MYRQVKHATVCQNVRLHIVTLFRLTERCANKLD
jgi:hypothetical protein